MINFSYFVWYLDTLGNDLGIRYGVTVFREEVLDRLYSDLCHSFNYFINMLFSKEERSPIKTGPFTGINVKVSSII